MATDRGKPSDGRDTRDLTPGYRAYLVKDGDKYLITIPVAEYDPDAPSLTTTQIAGIREIADLYHAEHPLDPPLGAKPIRYDPFKTAQNTGPKKGGGGASLAVPPWPDDPGS